ncbi:Alpha/Beta hydrolase protein [Scleroderma citrinum]
MVDEYLDIPYIASQPQTPFHKFDIYVPREIKTSSLCLLICFVHGGAWRSEDKSDHAVLARNLALSTGYPVAVPNYRLTPREATPDNIVRHPEHAKDILHFLEFICTAPDPRSSPQRLLLLGHSCAAHMLCTIFLDMPHGGRLYSSDIVLARTTTLVLSEGIYDIDTLLSSFPSYRKWFIEAVFGVHDSYADVSMTNAATKSGCGHIRWLIIHSKGDTLVDERQSQMAYDHLKSRAVEVCKSLDELIDEHNEILRGNQYIEIIRRHIQKIVATLE